MAEDTKKFTAADLNKQDTSLLADIEDAMANCMKCGNCQAVCPIYRETGKEQMVARGKISLMQGYLSGKIPISAEFDHIMAMCLNCKSCAANCPCGVAADELILRGRNAAVKARGLHPIKKNVFRLLQNRPLFDTALKLGGMFGWMTFKEVPDACNAADCCASFAQPISRGHQGSEPEVPRRLLHRLHDQLHVHGHGRRRHRRPQGE